VALRAGTSSRCAGRKEQVAAELTKRVADPSKITNAVGIEYALAVDGLCGQVPSAELRKKGFEIAKKLTDAKVPDAKTRRASLSALASCDPAAGAKILGALAKDRDKLVAEAAKIEAEVATLRAEIVRLVTAITMMDQPPAALITALTERKDRLNALDELKRKARMRK
jgi:hypothetical protein